MWYKETRTTLSRIDFTLQSIPSSPSLTIRPTISRVVPTNSDLFIILPSPRNIYYPRKKKMAAKNLTCGSFTSSGDLITSKIFMVKRQRDLPMSLLGSLSRHCERACGSIAAAIPPSAPLPVKLFMLRWGRLRRLCSKTRTSARYQYALTLAP